MFKFSTIFSLLTFLLIGTGLFSIQAQNWKLDPNAPVKVGITGTSTLHDWTVTCSSVENVPASLNFEAPGTIEGFGFKVLVDSMDGGRGSSMNAKIYEAFESSSNPYVSFQQSQPATVEKAESGYTITSMGTLSMAGTEKPVTVKCTGSIENGVLTISGNNQISMSDYGMTPPSAMFGQIKTNNKVTVNFEFRYITSDE
jgi:hypothetical protein